MKAAIVQGAGKSPIYADFAAPVPGPGEQRVSVTAAALSQVVKSRASGAHYSSPGQFPFVIGIDGVGRLDDGTRVYFVLPKAPYGSMAEQTVVPAAQCLPLPDELDDATAAAIDVPAIDESPEPRSAASTGAPGASKSSSVPPSEKHAILSAAVFLSTQTNGTVYEPKLRE